MVTESYEAAEAFGKINGFNHETQLQGMIFVSITNGWLINVGRQHHRRSPPQ